MIQELREYSNSIFFKMLLGLIAVTFVISFGVGGFLGDRKEVVAKVNGQEILIKEYREAYQNRLRALQQQFGENADKFAEQIDLRQQVFNELIDRNLLLAQADEFNLIATDLELQDFIRTQSYFQKNGQFDYGTYETVLKQNRLIRHEYENSLRTDLLLQKKQQLLGAGLVVTDQEVNAAYKREYEKIEVDYLYFDPQAFMEKSTITEDELRQYHQDHSEEFQSKDEYKVEYFSISAEQYLPVVQVKEREVRRYFKKNSAQYVTPAEIKASHILFKLDAEATDEQKANKTNELNKLLEKIKAGESFSELAQAHSEDGSAADGGNLGWFKSGEMVPTFETAAFALEAGQVSEVVESPFGLHLILVEERKNKITKELDDVRTEITELLKETRAQKELDEDLERLSGIAGESFNAEAEKLKKEIVTSDWFNRKQVIPGLGSASGLVQELKLRKSGEIGVWKRNPILGHVVYRLIENKAPETRPLEDAKADVEVAVRLVKAKTMATNAVKKALSEVKNGKKMPAVEAELGLKLNTIEFTTTTRFLPNIGENIEFRKASLALTEKNRFAVSYQNDRSDLIRFNKRSLDSEKVIENKEEIRSQLQQTLRQALLSKELKRLRNSATVEIINPLFRAPGAS